MVATSDAVARVRYVSLLTTAAMVAFAANSVLCRAALGGGEIDAASFSAIRLLSGALALSAIHAVRRGGRTPRRAGWFSAALLFLYAVPFSFAYNTLTTGTGALILFAAVQATMLVAGLAAGERPRLLQWIGLAAALGGMTYLVLPGVTAPSPTGSVLMAVAGIAWGLYSLHGRGAVDPLGESRDNFVRSVPMVAVVSLLSVGDFEMTLAGALLAVTSGALASGAGYVIWYTALGGLTATFAATVQLSVPVIAAAGGVLVMGESVTFRLVLSSVLILGGVARAGTPAIAAAKRGQSPTLYDDSKETLTPALLGEAFHEEIISVYMHQRIGGSLEQVCKRT